MSQPLFAGPPLQHGLAAIGDKLLDTAANLPAVAWKPDKHGNVPDIAANLANSVKLVLPVFDWDARTTTLREKPLAIVEYVPRLKARTSFQVPGFELTIAVPYAGSRLLVTSTPTERFIGGLDTRAWVEPKERAGRVDFTIADRHIDHSLVDTDFAVLRRGIKRYVGFVSDEVDRWRSTLLSSLRHEMLARHDFWSEFLSIATHSETEAPLDLSR